MPTVSVKYVESVFSIFLTFTLQNSFMWTNIATSSYLRSIYLLINCKSFLTRKVKGDIRILKICWSLQKVFSISGKGRHVLWSMLQTLVSFIFLTELFMCNKNKPWDYLLWQTIRIEDFAVRAFAEGAAMGDVAETRAQQRRLRWSHRFLTAW